VLILQVLLRSTVDGTPVAYILAILGRGRYLYCTPNTTNGFLTWERNNK